MRNASPFALNHRIRWTPSRAPVVPRLTLFWTHLVSEPPPRCCRPTLAPAKWRRLPAPNPFWSELPPTYRRQHRPLDSPLETPARMPVQRSGARRLYLDPTCSKPFSGTGSSFKAQTSLPDQTTCCHDRAARSRAQVASRAATPAAAVRARQSLRR